MAKVLIIGGGVSGLTAGIYAQKAGLESVVYERHRVPGGLLSWWRREGFLIDNCVHWLTGTNDQTDIYKVWQDVGVLGDDVHVIQPESFMQVELDGQTLNVWHDINRLHEDLLRVAPEDEKAIEEFMQLLHLYQGVALVAHKPMEQLSLWEYAKLLWSMRKVGKVHRVYSKMLISDYAKRFKSPLIRKMLNVYFPKFYNVSSLFYVYAAFCNSNADLPQGGSKGMVDRMLERYQSLGGVLQTGWAAEQINIQEGHAYSVTFSNGTTVEADYVISTCDLYHTMAHLLPKEYMDPYMREHFIDLPKKYPTYSSVNLYFAVDHITQDIPCAMALDIANLSIDNRPVETGFLKHFNYETSFSPEGKSILQVLLTQYEDDYDFWERLRREDFQAYRAEKNLVAKTVQDALEQRFAELQGHITLLDVATPVTNTRYCNVYKGAFMSFALTSQNEKIYHRGRIQGVDNLYLAGQWLQAPGGLPNAVVTGKFAVQRMLKDHKELRKK